MKRDEVRFRSGDADCAAWLFRPAPRGTDVPCVVMAHGMSLTRHDGLAAFAEVLAAAGTAVLVYDHRYLGDSSGQPRQLVHPSAQLQDRRAAIAYARGLDGIDADRIVVWGYSFSGGSAVNAAATDRGIAGAILLFPFLDSVARGFTSWRTERRNVTWVARRMIRDRSRSTTLPVTAHPGQHGLMAFPGEATGFGSVVTSGSPWRNEVLAGPLAAASLYRPVTKARKIGCPVLVQLGENDVSAPPRAIQKVARRAPRAELMRYPLDHFEPFYDDDALGVAADQAEWLNRTVLGTD